MTLVTSYQRVLLSAFGLFLCSSVTTFGEDKVVILIPVAAFSLERKKLRGCGGSKAADGVYSSATSCSNNKFSDPSTAVVSVAKLFVHFL